MQPSNGVDCDMDAQGTEDSKSDDFADPVWQKTRQSRRRVFLAVMVTAVFLLSAVQAIALNAKAAAESRTFTLGMGESVTSANPFVGIYDSDYLFYSYIYDYLTYPNEDGVQSPNLASSWWYMDGNTAFANGSSFAGLAYPDPADWPFGSIWEYNLTQNVRWSDGEPFTADDVVYTIKIQTGSSYINFWAYQPYTKWIDHAEKITEFKVRVFFADHGTHVPVPAVWADSMSIPMLPKHVFSDYPDLYVAQDWTGVPAIGTGPFKGTAALPNEIIAKESITLVKNPWYDYTEDGVRLGLGGVYNRTNEIDRLIMKFFAEEQTLILELKTEKLDTTEVTANAYFALKSDANKPAGLTLTSLYSSTVYSKISHFNVWAGATGSLNPARQDPALLRASAVATNKSYVTDVIYKGLATPGVGIISPVWPKYYWDPPHNVDSTFNVTDENGLVLFTYTKPLDEVMEFDLDLANDILDAAGYVWTDASHTLRKIGQVAADRLVGLGIIGDAAVALNKALDFEDILEQEVFEDKETAEYLAQEWEHIGIKITPKPVNVGTWLQLVYGFQYHFTETYWSGDVDPNYLMYIPTSYAMDGWNEFGTMNATYDHYYNMQAQTFNFTERKYWLDECQKWQYLAGGAMIYTVYPLNTYAFNDANLGSGKWTNWGNWTAHPGLAVDHFWGETPLYYHVRWVGGDGPTEFPWALVIAGIGIAGIVAAAAAVMVMRKRRDKMLGEEEDEEEETEENP